MSSRVYRLVHSPLQLLRLSGGRFISQSVVSSAQLTPHNKSSDLQTKPPWTNQQCTPDTPSISSSHIQTVKPPKLQLNVPDETIEPTFPHYLDDITNDTSANDNAMEATATTAESIPPWNVTDFRPYKDRSTLELLNSFLVFQTCRIPALASIVAPIIAFAESLKVTTPVYAVIRRTYFAHFCGGESIDEVKKTSENLASHNVGTIADLAMEQDVGGVVLQGEEARIQASKIKDMMMQSIDIASSQPDSFIAAKITAFVPPAILQRWSNTIRLLKKLFDVVDKNRDGIISQSEFAKLTLDFASVPSSVEGANLTATTEKLFALGDKNKDRGLDWIELTDLFSLGNAEARPLIVELIKHASIPQTKVAKTDEMWHEVNDLATLEDFDTLNLVLKELDSLCVYAKEKGVRIMIDAEQTYFQPAIDDIALFLSRKFNPQLDSDVSVPGKLNTPVIYNTYQMYLVDAYKRLEEDVARAERLNYSFGIKIVRGAYMASERKRAKEFGYPDPINPDIDSTHKLYNKAIDFLVSKIKSHITSTGSAKSSASTSSKTVPLSFVIASHNLESIHHAQKVMNKLSSSDTSTDEKRGQPLIAFAQLMGMKDGISFGLAANGYKVYKYVPYGPIHVTIPYLIRRAQENSALLGGQGAIEDRKVISQEVWRRLFG